MDVARELESAGLTAGESRAYAALLTLDSAKAGAIAQKSGVAYSKIYDVLARLEKKGLVSHVVSMKIRRYTVASPQRIIEYLAGERDKAQSQYDGAKRLLPTLYSLIKETGVPEAELFIGPQGLRTAHEKLIEGQDRAQLCFFYAADPHIDVAVGAFFTRLERTYRSRGLRLRGIAPMRYKRSPHRTRSQIYEVRFVRSPVPNNIAFIGNRTLISAWKSGIAILISSADVTEGFRTYFEEVWASAR